jgi:hypothetical protein
VIPLVFGAVAIAFGWTSRPASTDVAVLAMLVLVALVLRVRAARVDGLDRVPWFTASVTSR